jgi:hypothetical protein
MRAISAPCGYMRGLAWIKKAIQAIWMTSYIPRTQKLGYFELCGLLCVNSFRVFLAKASANAGSPRMAFLGLSFPH